MNEQQIRERLISAFTAGFARLRNELDAAITEAFASGVTEDIGAQNVAASESAPPASGGLFGARTEQAETPPPVPPATEPGYNPFKAGNTAAAQPAVNPKMRALAGLMADETLSQFQANGHIRNQDPNLLGQFRAALAGALEGRIGQDVMGGLMGDPTVPGSSVGALVNPSHLGSLGELAGNLASDLMQTPGLVELNGAPTLG